MWLGPLAFTVVALLPLFKRLRHPTILGDDVIRIVDLINLPFDKHLFQPFGDHLAPGFQLVSWLTWEAIGHDIRLAPLGFSFASVTAWVFVLVLLGLWLKQETGSTTATLVALAVVAQSPLVLETAWWYSSSSFSWAVAGILIAVLGASRIGHRPRSSLFWIGIGSALGPAGTTLGILAAPLAILRAATARETTRRNKLLAVVAAAAGFFVLRGIQPARACRRYPLSSRAKPAVDRRHRRLGLCRYCPRSGALAVHAWRARFMARQASAALARGRRRLSGAACDDGARRMAAFPVGPSIGVGWSRDGLLLLRAHLLATSCDDESGSLDRARILIQFRRRDTTCCH